MHAGTLRPSSSLFRWIASTGSFITKGEGLLAGISGRSGGRGRRPPEDGLGLAPVSACRVAPQISTRQVPCRCDTHWQSGVTAQARTCGQTSRWGWGPWGPAPSLPGLPERARSRSTCAGALPWPRSPACSSDARARLGALFRPVGPTRGLAARSCMPCGCPNEALHLGLKTDTLSLFSLGLHAPSPKASSALVTAAPTSHGDPHTRHSCAHAPHQDPRAFPVIAVTQDHTLGSDDRPLPAPVWRPEGRARKAGLRGPGRSFLPVPPAAPDGGAGAHVLPAMLAMTTSRETLHLVTS